LVFRGTSTFYGAIIAPDTDVLFEGTTNFYGVVIAKSLTFEGDVNLHVDEVLVREITNQEPLTPVLVK